MLNLRSMIVILTSIFTLTATYAAIDLQSGLEAHYKLDGNALDSSGAGLDGVVYNATVTTDRFGMAGSAMYFDGSGDYLDMGNLSEWNFGSAPFSVSLWFKADGVATRKLVLLTVQNGASDIEFSIGYGGTWGSPESDDDKLGLGINYASPVWGRDVIGTQSLSDAEWHHVVLTRNGDSWNLYLDGAETPEVSTTYSFNPGAGQLLVGTHITSDRFFAGAIDDVRIYNRVLSAAEIAALTAHLYITDFHNGYLTWVNIDTNLYYTVEWRPSLTGSNHWSGSYRGCQDIRSTNDFITVPVPVFYRVTGTNDPAHTAILSPESTGIAAGYYETTDLALIDTDLVAANLRAGTTVFGVSGNTNVVNTGSGDAVAGDILAGKKAWVDGAEVTGAIATRTLSDTNDTVSAGYYSATTLSAVDTDLAAGNIATNVTIFGITGILNTNAVVSGVSAPVPKTGQTVSYLTGDDGNLERGVAWPNPRFTDNTNGTVTDSLTGLIWLKNASALGQLNWSNALAACNTLTNGMHGLTDGSMVGDWRLPNIQELQSVIDYGHSSPALALGHPFIGELSQAYWTGTTYDSDTAGAWCVHVSDGSIFIIDKTSGTPRAWPVRGGVEDVPDGMVAVPSGVR